MDRVEQSFDSQALMKTIGAELTEVSPGRVVIELPVTPALGQQHGVVHAGATFAIGDTAAGFAALSLMKPGDEVMTVEMKINLLRPADGLRLIATGEVIKSGRRLFVSRATVEAESQDGTRQEIAVLQGTMIPVSA